MSVENELPNEELNNSDELNSEQTVQENQDAPETQEEQLIDEYKDKFVRLYAEFDNYRRRTNEEKLNLIASAGKDVISSMLPVLDNFERAIVANANVGGDSAARGIVIGMLLGAADGWHLPPSHRWMTGLNVMAEAESLMRELAGGSAGEL